MPTTAEITSARRSTTTRRANSAATASARATPVAPQKTRRLPHPSFPPAAAPAQASTATCRKAPSATGTTSTVANMAACARASSTATSRARSGLTFPATLRSRSSRASGPPSATTCPSTCSSPRQQTTKGSLQRLPFFFCAAHPGVSPQAWSSGAPLSSCICFYGQGGVTLQQEKKCLMPAEALGIQTRDPESPQYPAQPHPQKAAPQSARQSAIPHRTGLQE